MPDNMTALNRLAVSICTGINLWHGDRALPTDHYIQLCKFQALLQAYVKDQLYISCSHYIAQVCGAGGHKPSGANAKHTAPLCVVEFTGPQLWGPGLL